MTISFTDRVAIVTGAGGGIGREYALELAKRGAKVVVNDLGGSRDGSGQSDAAEQVAEEIRSSGGEAMANGGSVTEFEQMEKMVADAMQKWGGVHVLLNNAGILRDKSFSKMTMDDFNLVLQVHTMGSANCTKAVWEIMKEQAYGRIMMTTGGRGGEARVAWQPRAADSTTRWRQRRQGSARRARVQACRCRAPPEAANCLDETVGGKGGTVLVGCNALLFRTSSFGRDQVGQF